MDDELLRALGRAQRDDLDGSQPAADADDDAWAGLAEPFDDATREGLLDDVFARVDATEAAASEPEAAADSLSVIALGSRRRGVVIGLLFAAAAAVTLGIWWSRGTPRDPGTAVALLPRYETRNLHGGPASQRGPADPVPESLRMAASDELDWVVTPSKRVSGPIAVALLVEGDGAEPMLVRDTKAAFSMSGVVRIQAPLADIVALEPGDWTLTLLIAPVNALPADVEQARSAEAPTWQQVSIRVTITPDP